MAMINGKTEEEFLLSHLVVDYGLHFVETRGEGLEFHGLSVLNRHLLRLVECRRHFAAVQGVDQDVKGTDGVQQGQVSDRG